MKFQGFAKNSSL